MIKTTLFSITGALALAVTAQATTVTLSAGFSGPFVEKIDGTRVNGGLVLLGTMTDAQRDSLSAGSLSADVDAVFAEFGTRNSSATGSIAGSFTNVGANAGDFDGKQIYIWVFNGTDKTSAEHALFTVANPAAPGTGNPWLFPANLGGVGDGTTISVAALLANSNNGVPRAIAGNNLRLVPAVPEPSGALLAGLAGAALLFRRRR